MNRLTVSWRQVGAALLLLGLGSVGASQAAATADENLLEVGRRIYSEGLLSDGSKLTGTRGGNTTVSGAVAACENCHRPSGMGQVEGDIAIPPIAGSFLFANPGDKPVATMDSHVRKFFNQSHEPYTDASLANAILQGVNSQGKPMNLAMPRFNLNALELQAVAVYLKQLSAQWSPGVTTSTIRFATVITPDVDPARRKVVKDMMQLIVRQKNGSTHIAQQGRSRHHMTSAAELILGTERKWDLDIWELKGAPNTWAGQLNDLYQRQPVFALLSGVSSGTWQPVHDFCERERVPCWFPSLDAPVAKSDKYSFYFSGGVALEANVLAHHLLKQKSIPAKLVQIYHDDDIGRAAALALSRALAGSTITLESRILKSDVAGIQALKTSIAPIGSDAVAMFWLRPNDVLDLSQLQPVGAQQYFSAILAKGEHAPLSAPWRASAHLIYPYELPEQRAVQLNYFNAWRNLRKVELVDEALQSEIFFAMSFMTDTVSEMLENFYRDYLIERAETMLSKREGGKAEQETRDRLMLGNPGDLERKHGLMKMDESVRVPIRQSLGTDTKTQGTTMYPHMSLAPGQRFASKGAYIVRFARDSGDEIVPETEFIAP
jgi:hypothetical protein